LPISLAFWAPQSIEHVGDDHFLYASDVPHWDGEFPIRVSMTCGIATVFHRRPSAKRA
jgi:hypothetical protein